MKSRKLFGFLLTLVMLIGLLPLGQVAYAASVTGLSETDPRIVNNYNEFKSAMEDPSILYVKLNSVNTTIGKSGTGLIAGAQITSTKTLILNGTSTFTALKGDYCAVDSLLYVANGGSLSVKGSGSLTFKSNASNGNVNSTYYVPGDSGLSLAGASAASGHILSSQLKSYEIKEAIKNPDESANCIQLILSIFALSLLLIGYKREESTEDN